MLEIEVDKNIFLRIQGLIFPFYNLLYQANASDSTQTLGKENKLWDDSEMIQALRMAERSFDREKDELLISVFMENEVQRWLQANSHFW